jgi:hypothetical protein
VLGRVVDPALGTSYKSAERRAIDDRATSLFAHLLQFELHAAQFAAEIDPHYAVVILSGSVCGLCEDILDARVAIGGIEPAESSDRLLDHGIDLHVIGDIATNGDGLRPWAVGSWAAACTASSFQSASATDAPDSAKAFAVARPSPDAAPVTSATFSSIEMFMETSPVDLSDRSASALCALSLCLGVAVAFDGDLRRGGIDVPKIRGRKLDRTRADVLLETAELGGAGDRGDPRLLRQ